MFYTLYFNSRIDDSVNSLESNNARTIAAHAPNIARKVSTRCIVSKKSLENIESKSIRLSGFEFDIQAGDSAHAIEKRARFYARAIRGIEPEARWSQLLTKAEFIRRV